MSPYSIQESIHYPDSHPTSPPGHGGTGGPLIGVGVIAFHCAQAGGAITPTHCIQPVKRIKRKLITKAYISLLIVYHANKKCRYVIPI